MSAITSQADCTNLTSVSDLARFVAIFQKSVISAVNGNIEFGSNVKTTLVTGTLANGSAITIAHGLGRTPQGFLLAGSNKAVRIYNTKASDSTNIYPIGDATATVTILVF